MLQRRVEFVSKGFIYIKNPRVLYFIRNKNKFISLAGDYRTILFLDLSRISVNSPIFTFKLVVHV